MIIDAGPALSFFATNNERVLLSVVGGYLSCPETVKNEVLNKAHSDRRFAPAQSVWAKLEGRRLTVLSDDATPELEAAVQRLALSPMTQRMRQARDLGEDMVVAHASVAAMSGEHVGVIIDERRGAEMATAEKRRLDRLRAQDQSVGSISIYNTMSILKAAGIGKHIPNKNTMRRVYGQLRSCDDGLVDISQTDLLSRDVWS